MRVNVKNFNSLENANSKKSKDKKLELELKPSVLPEVIKNNNDETVEKIFSKLSKENSEWITQATNYIGKKIDSINNNIKSKPTSFIFDVKRDDKGYIDKVIVKPNK